MLYYKNGQWYLCTEKVGYMQYGERIEQFIGHEGKLWWLDFEQKWEHTEIVEFIPVEHTDEEIKRLEEINQLNIPDGYTTILSDYVKNGVFPKDLNHPLKKLQLQKENITLSNYILDVDMRLTMQELGL